MTTNSKSAVSLAASCDASDVARAEDVYPSIRSRAPEAWTMPASTALARVRCAEACAGETKRGSCRLVQRLDLKFRSREQKIRPRDEPDRADADRFLAHASARGTYARLFHARALVRALTPRPASASSVRDGGEARQHPLVLHPRGEKNEER